MTEQPQPQGAPTFRCRHLKGNGDCGVPTRLAAPGGYEPWTQAGEKRAPKPEGKTWLGECRFRSQPQGQKDCKEDFDERVRSKYRDW